MTTYPVPTETLPAEEQRSLLLFVPVDGSAAAQRTVSHAIDLAPQSAAGIVLVGLLDGDAAAVALDVAEAQAAPTAAEFGYGAIPLLSTLTAPSGLAEAIGSLLWQVLLPLQRRVRAAGIASEVRVLRGSDPAAQLRAQIAAAPVGRTVVLDDPGVLAGPLRDITLDLLVRPPCSLYLLGRSRPATAPRRRTIMEVLAGLWRSH